MPNGNNLTSDWWDQHGFNPTSAGFGSVGGGRSSGGVLSYGGSGPAYERVTSLPGFMPRINDITSELADEYRNTPLNFDTSGYEAASKGQESRVLTTALNAGNNAATEYANRARQAGGSGLGAGLVKAEASVGARTTAGQMALDREKYMAGQREKAASQAGQIATTLAGLRDSYLKSLVEYSTKEDSISADYRAKMAALDAAGSSRGSGGVNAEPPSSWTPGYVTNAGPIQNATVNGQTLPNGAFGSVPTNWWETYGRRG